MNIITKIATLFFCATLVMGCNKAPADVEQDSELDWSRTSTITLADVAMAASAKGTDQPMLVDKTFRLYAIDPKTKKIIDTRTYTITGTDGTPKVDDSQEAKIMLPFGAVDIFLVGPVKAKFGIYEYEIAGPTMVTPKLGVDLISSKTRVIIETTETTITPAPLKHRMVKLEVAINMENDNAEVGKRASYVNANMTNEKHGVVINNVSTFGTFTFDDNGGSVIGAADSYCRYTYTINNSGERNLKQTSAGVDVTDGNVGSSYSAYDYIFPTEPTQPKLTVTYGYTFRSGSSVEAHEMSGKTASNQTWEGGTYVKIHTTLTPSIIMTLHSQILPWDDGGTTSVEPPVNDNLVFWYSGEDAPEEINGKMCWRDRSGNGNHAELSGGMTYDAVNKCYYATKTDDRFFVPALGKLAEYTLELTAQSVNDAANNAANFGKTGVPGGLGIHLPYSPWIVYYCPKQIQYEYTRDNYIFEQLQSYAFCRNSTTAAIVINGEQKYKEDNSDDWSPFDNNILWANTHRSLGKQKLYGAKMYKKYMNDVAGRNTLAANYAAKLSQLGVTAPLSGTTFDYVKDGLILDLRGETAPTGISPNRVWPDQSAYRNSPKLDVGVVHKSDVARGTHYYGGTNSTDYIQFKRSLGTYKELTIEIVTEFMTSGVENPLIQFSPISGDMTDRSGIYWCYPYIGYIFEAPYIRNNTLRTSIDPQNLKYSQNTLSQLSCYRRGDKLYASQNGYMYSDYVADAPSGHVNQLINGVIYTNFQHIYAVRIYNRALSDMERQHNYLVDKVKYKILY